MHLVYEMLEVGDDDGVARGSSGVAGRCWGNMGDNEAVVCVWVRYVCNDLWVHYDTLTCGHRRRTLG